MLRISLSLRDISLLREIAGSKNYTDRVRRRATIVLMCSEGRAVNNIAHDLGTTRKTVKKSCQRFRNHGLDGILQDAPRSGRYNGHKRPSIDEIMNVILQREPSRSDRWSVRALARECGTSPSTMHRLVRLHRIPLSSYDIKMLYYSQASHPMTDIAGLFLSPTLKAVAFLCEASEDKSPQVPEYGGFPLLSRNAHPNESFVPSTTSIHLMMAKTNEPGTVIHLRIPLLQNDMTAPSRRLDVPLEAVAFFHYKVAELVRTMGVVIHVVDPGRRQEDIEMLVFLETVERKVPRDTDVVLVMNSLLHDPDDRISKWLARHPRFRVSVFADDRVWLAVVEDHANEIPDEHKRRVTFTLEHFLATIAEREGEKAMLVICYLQQ